MVKCHTAIRYNTCMLSHYESCNINWIHSTFFTFESNACQKQQNNCKGVTASTFPIFYFQIRNDNEYDRNIVRPLNSQLFSHQNKE